MATCCMYEYRNPETGSVETWFICRRTGGPCKTQGPNFTLVQSAPVPRCENCHPQGASVEASASLCRQRIAAAQQALDTWTGLLEQGAVLQPAARRAARKKSSSKAGKRRSARPRR